jgi:hypothetical protein
MPTACRFLFWTTAFFIFIMFKPVKAENVGRDLIIADSLFEGKKYTESFEVYHSLLTKGYYSRSMLLKMAFIKEGLGDFTQALYYLDFYAQLTGDVKVLNKMEKIAEEHQLIGYQQTDLDFFLSLLDKFLLYILSLLGAFCLLWIAIIYRKKKNGLKPVGWGIVLVLNLLALFVLGNYDLKPSRGILMDNHVYLMSAPSSGSQVVEIVSKGHKVEVLKEGDIWTRIRWKNQPVYVRNEKIHQTI